MIDTTVKGFDTVIALERTDDGLQQFFNVCDMVLSVPSQMSGIVFASFHDRGVFDSYKEELG